MIYNPGNYLVAILGAGVALSAARGAESFVTIAIGCAVIWIAGSVE
jgi:hypothetical protein